MHPNREILGAVAGLALFAGACGNEVSAQAARWYMDCDGDGYAAAGTIPADSQTPPALPKNCAAWTITPPGTGTTDCNDTNAEYHPGAVFGVADEKGNGDLNCDGKVEKKWTFDAPELRLDSFYMSKAGGWNGAWKLCDVRKSGVPASVEAFVVSGQCPCYVEWEGPDAQRGVPKWTTSELACSPSNTEWVTPINLRLLEAGTCQPTGKVRPGVQRCR